VSLTAEDLADLTDEFEELAAAEAAAAAAAAEEAAALARAATVADRMEAAAQAAGVSLDSMSASIGKLIDQAEKSKALEEAKKALDDINGVKPPAPIDEVTAAMQKLTKAAHEAKVLEEAKRRLGQTGTEAGGAAKGMEALGESAKGAVDGLKPTGGVLGSVTSALEAMGPKGKAVAVALAVVVTVVGAVAIALWGLVKAAVAVTQRKDALIQMFGAIGRGSSVALRGAVVLRELSALAKELPLSKDKILEWGRSFMAVGKHGEALKTAIRAVASATALMGEEGGQAAEGLIKRFALMHRAARVQLDKSLQQELAQAGIAAEDLAQALGKPVDKLHLIGIRADKLGEFIQRTLARKGGAALENMSLTWESISTKLREGWNDLFSDLGPAVRPLMMAVRDFFAEFGVGTTLQGAAKGALTSFFTTILGWATKAVRGIHLGFLEIQIAALKVYIAAAPLVRLMRAIFSNAEVLRGIKTILVLIAIPFVLLAVMVAAVGAALIVLGTIFAYIGGLIVGAVTWIVGAISGFVSSLISGGTSGGEGFIAGLVNSIKAGVGAVVDGIKGLASKMLGAFTSAFEIKSPSKKMFRHGLNIDKGVEQGVDAGADDAQDAMDAMVSPSKPRPRGGSRKQGRGGRSASFINCVFWGTTEEKVRALWEKFLEQEAAAGPDAEPEGA